MRIVNAGLCHSDVSVLDGTIPFPTPVVLGHEGAGVVEEIGSAVRKVQVGDHVVLTTLGSCGLCDACDRGQPTHCRDTMGRLNRPFTVAGRAGLPVRQRRRVHRAHRRRGEPGGRHLQGDAARRGVPHRMCRRHRRGRGAQPSQGAAGRDGRRHRRRRHRPVGDPGRAAQRRGSHRRHRRQPGQGGGRSAVRRHRLPRRIHAHRRRRARAGREGPGAARTASTTPSSASATPR